MACVNLEQLSACVFFLSIRFEFHNLISFNKKYEFTFHILRLSIFHFWRVCVCANDYIPPYIYSSLDLIIFDQIAVAAFIFYDNWNHNTKQFSFEAFGKFILNMPFTFWHDSSWYNWLGNSKATEKQRVIDYYFCSIQSIHENVQQLGQVPFFISAESAVVSQSYGATLQWDRCL